MVKVSLVVPSVRQLTEGLDLHVAAALQPSLDGQTLLLIGGARVLCLRNHVAGVIGQVPLAGEPVRLHALAHKGMQKLLALGGFYIALVLKGKFKAEFTELAHTVLLAESFLHSARIIRPPARRVKPFFAP